MTNKLKFIGISIVGAIGISAIQFVIAINSSTEILWQVIAIQHLVGPGPILGYTANGQPLYEGTPVQMIAAYIGLLLGAVIYAMLIYFVLCKHRKKDNNFKDIQDGFSKI